jgi:hypothetical protein
MRPWRLVAALATALLVATPLHAGEPVLVLGGFAPPAEPEGAPPGWQPLTFRKIPRRTTYTVVRDGEAYILRAESDASASVLYRPVDVDPTDYPVLTWRWKVENVLDRADARRKEGDDYPARVYVAFRYDPAAASLWERARYGAIRLAYGQYPPRHVINYVWDNRLPPGTTLDNAYTDRAKMVVLRSGPADVGRWVSEMRNVAEDYRRLFDAAPPRVAGVAVMTDTDDTGEHAVAFYADIALHRRGR